MTRTGSRYRVPPWASGHQIASLLVALLVGLEMQHRVDPSAVSDETAVLGLRLVTGLRAATDPTAGRITDTTAEGSPARTTKRSTTSRTTSRTNPKPGTARRTSPTRRTS